MLVAVYLDGNDAVLPIAFCGVQEENLDSWAFFLKHLYEGLYMDYMVCGKGISFPTMNIGNAVSGFLKSFWSNTPTIVMCTHYFRPLAGVQTIILSKTK